MKGNEQTARERERAVTKEEAMEALTDEGEWCSATCEEERKTLRKSDQKKGFQTRTWSAFVCLV